MIEVGDKLTISGVYQSLPNPDRRWWQVWKPRRIPGGPQFFRVVSAQTGEIIMDDMRDEGDAAGLGEWSKRDFRTNRTLTERIEALEKWVSDIDGPRLGPSPQDRVHFACDGEPGLKPTALEEVVQRIQGLTDRVHSQADKLEKIGERVMGPLPEVEQGKLSAVNSPDGTLDHVFMALTWLDHAIERLDRAALRLERV